MRHCIHGCWSHTNLSLCNPNAYSLNYCSKLSHYCFKKKETYCLVWGARLRSALSDKHAAKLCNRNRLLDCITLKIRIPFRGTGRKRSVKHYHRDVGYYLEPRPFDCRWLPFQDILLEKYFIAYFIGCFRIENGG